MTCIAPGYYYDSVNIYRPLLALSQDAGSSWTYPASISSSALPLSFINGSFLAGSCSGATCIATGTFNDGFVNRPLLALSQNAVQAGLILYPSTRQHCHHHLMLVNLMVGAVVR